MLFCAPLGGANGKALERLKNHATIQAEVAQTPVDAISLMLKRGMGVIVFRIQERAQFQLALSLLQALQNGIAQGAVQFVVTTPVSNPQLTDRLRSAGVTEIIQEPIADRSLAFKLERFGKMVQSFKARVSQQQKVAERAKKVDSLAQQAAAQAGAAGTGVSSQNPAGGARAEKELGKVAGSQPASSEKAPPPGDEKKTGKGKLKAQTSERALGVAGKGKGKGKVRANELRWGPPIQHESDLWIASECVIKAVGDRWVIRHQGPGPGAGKWVETSGKGLDRPHSDTKFFEWSWHEKEVNPFIQVPGRWIFCGIRAPEFIDEMWWFSGRRPSLFFVCEGRVQAAKFAASPEGTLIVAKDSPRATALLPRFVETWKKGVKVRQKKAASEGEEENSELSSQRGGFGAGGSQSNERAQVSRFGTLIRTPALPLESDFWTLNVEQTLAREGGTWQVALLGPSSGDAHWIERPSASGKLWVFTPKTKKVVELHRELGEWTLSGASPRFEKGLWIFEGEAPRLDFRAPGGITKGIRLNTRKDHALLVARDSRTAVQLASGLKKEAKGFGFVESEGDEKKGIEFDYLDRREQKEGALLEAEKGELEAAAFNDRLKREEEESKGADDFIDRPEEHGLDVNDRRGPDVPRKGWKTWKGTEPPSRAEFEGSIRETTNDLGEVLYEYPELMFGKRGGRFDFVSTEVVTVPAPGGKEGAGSRVDRGAPYEKLFVFVPAEALLGKIADFSSVPNFWTYAGLSKPELDLARQIYTFRFERPVEVAGFGNLQPFVQRYLLELLESCKREPELSALPSQPTPILRDPAAQEPTEREEEEEEQRAREAALKREFEEDGSDLDDPSSQEEGAATDTSKDEKQESAPGTENAVEDESSADQDSPKRSKDEPEDTSRDASAPQSVKRKDAVNGEPEVFEAPLLALRKKRQREQKAALEAAMEKVAEKIPDEVRAEIQAAVAAVRREDHPPTPVDSEESPTKVPKGTPVEPGIRALGLVLFASELARRPSVSARELLVRLLGRWSSSLGGLRLELLRAEARAEPGSWAKIVEVPGSTQGESSSQSLDFESGGTQFRLTWTGTGAELVSLSYQKQVILGLTGLLGEAEPEAPLKEASAA